MRHPAARLARRSASGRSIRARQSAARTGAERSAASCGEPTTVQQRIIKLELPPGTVPTGPGWPRSSAPSKTRYEKALLLLSSAGLVYPRPAQLQVSPITLKDAHGLFACGRCSKSEAAALAARRKIDGRSRAQLEPGRDHVRSGRPGQHRLLPYDARFHILEASSAATSTCPIRLPAPVGQAERLLRFVAVLGELPLDDSTADHHRLIEAITKGDAAAARGGRRPCHGVEQLIVGALLSSDAIQDANVAASSATKPRPESTPGHRPTHRADLSAISRDSAASAFAE